MRTHNHVGQASCLSPASRLPQKTTWKTVLSWLALLSPMIAASAQNYAIDWFKVAGGGGTSTGGVYALSGTVGQHDAGGPHTGGNYSLVGGFWSLIAAVPTAGLPALRIGRSGNSVIVAWPNTATCTLQQSADLAAGNWVTSPYTITTLNGTNSITIPSPAGKLFFRLKQ